MPIYEYRRPDGTTFEVMQSFQDDPLTHDPDTGVPVERVLSAPAIHFKGKGFHNTDYGTRKRQREMSSSSSDSGGDKSESKSSEKKESKDTGASSSGSSESGSSGSSSSKTD
jgi:putative FmdB family regulatory protein